MEINGIDYTLVTLDFETYYGPKYSLSLQAMNTFKYVTDDQFKIHGVGVKIDSAETVYHDYHDPQAEHQFSVQLQALKAQNKPIALLCHNTQFDAFILHHHYDWHPDLYLDTMAMSRGMFVGYSASLKELAIRLWPNSPELRKQDELESTYGLRELPDKLRAPFARYCIRDVELTYCAFQVMFPHYPESEIQLIHITNRFVCEPWWYVDRALVQAEIDHQVDITQSTIAASGLSKTRLSSNPQFLQWLADNNVQVGYKENAKGDEIPALGQKDWEYQKMTARHPELAPVWEARKVAKSNIQESRARWFDSVASWLGGQMPVPLNYYGADTGRFSGGEKLNLQNLPRIGGDPNSGRLRRSLIAPEGHVTIVRDLSNIESRMLAYVAGEDYLLDLFRNGGDAYLHLASNIYNFDFNTATKKTHGGERNVGKVGVLGLGYGMGANKFWITLNTGPMGMPPIPMPFEEAKAVVDVYRKTNSNIKNYWDKCTNIIYQMYIGNEMDFGCLGVTQNMLIMPNGMALQYPNLTLEENSWGGFDATFGPRGPNKKVYGGLLTENIVQALSRVLICEQWLAIEKRLQENYGLDKARTVHMVHDELIVIAPESDADDILAMMGEEMSKTPAWCSGLPLDSDGGYAVEYSK